MSYLYLKDIDDLINAEGDLEWTVEQLTALGYADDVAHETQQIRGLIDQFKRDIQVRADRLRDVWENIDKWVSHDRGEDDVRRALERYRAGK